MSDFRKTKDRRAGTWKLLKKLDEDASLRQQCLTDPKKAAALFLEIGGYENAPDALTVRIIEDNNAGRDSVVLIALPETPRNFNIKKTWTCCWSPKTSTDEPGDNRPDWNNDSDRTKGTREFVKRLDGDGELKQRCLTDSVVAKQTFVKAGGYTNVPDSVEVFVAANNAAALDKYVIIALPEVGGLGDEADFVLDDAWVAGWSRWRQMPMGDFRALGDHARATQDK